MNWLVSMNCGFVSIQNGSETYGAERSLQYILVVGFSHPYTHFERNSHAGAELYSSLDCEYQNISFGLNPQKSVSLNLIFVSLYLVIDEMNVKSHVQKALTVGLIEW